MLPNNQSNNTAQSGATQTGAAQTGATQTGAIPKFEDWLKGQPDTVQQLINQRFQSLESTVRATRTERDNFSSQVRDLTKKAEKGSEMERELTTLSQKLEAAERKSDFMDQAIKPEIGCRNPAAAYAVALSGSMFNSKGVPDWDAIKKAVPELFGANVPKANAGNDGGGQLPTATNDMNTLIRRKAGRVS